MNPSLFKDVLLAVAVGFTLLFSTRVMAQKAAASALRVVFVTTSAGDIANKLARNIVESKLAACVNIVPGVQSIYVWEGKVQEDAEHLMIIKTVEDAIPLLRERILSLHPYDTPEFVALPVTEESAAYADWVRNQTTRRLGDAVDPASSDTTTITMPKDEH